MNKWALYSIWEWDESTHNCMLLERNRRSCWWWSHPTNNTSQQKGDKQGKLERRQTDEKNKKCSTKGKSTSNTKKTFKCIQYTYIFEILKMEKIWRVWKAIKNMSEWETINAYYSHHISSTRLHCFSFHWSQGVAKMSSYLSYSTFFLSNSRISRINMKRVVRYKKSSYFFSFFSIRNKSPKWWPVIKICDIVYNNYNFACV